eukprot:jgi/Tetstr1/447258/TSEL_034695.t1
MVVLHDPVLMYVSLLSFQILLFPEMGWQTFVLGMLATAGMYMSHDLIFSDEKTFFVRVDMGLQGTTWFLLVCIVVVQVFQALRVSIASGIREGWEEVKKAIPISAVLMIKNMVDTHADNTMFDNAWLALDYGRTLLEYGVKYTQIGFDAMAGGRLSAETA